MGQVVSKPLVILALAGALAPGPVTGEDGSLYHQQRLQQQKSQFQLMLQQLNERSRQRARERAQSQRRAGTANAGSSPAMSLERGHQPLRLTTRPGTASSQAREPAQTPQRIQSRQEREQLRQGILDEQQRRRALVAGRRAAGTLPSRDTASKRRELNIFRTQGQRRSFQRKLTY